MLFRKMANPVIHVETVTSLSEAKDFIENKVISQSLGFDFNLFLIRSNSSGCRVC